VPVVDQLLEDAHAADGRGEDEHARQDSDEAGHAGPREGQERARAEEVPAALLQRGARVVAEGPAHEPGAREPGRSFRTARSGSPVSARSSGGSADSAAATSRALARLGRLPLCPSAIFLSSSLQQQPAAAGSSQQPATSSSQQQPAAAGNSQQSRS
jgi:hypothetical protein